MDIITIKPKIERVETFLTNTFRSFGSLSPKSNVKIICNGETFETVKVGENVDTKETYFFTENFILIFPENSFDIVNKKDVNSAALVSND